MASFTSFTIMGHLTADPEIRYTASGVPVCTFAVAVNSRRKNGEGQATEHVDFFRITTKFKLADLCLKFLQKGRPVFVNGELESWKGEGKFGINFVANTVQFLGGDKRVAPAGAGRSEAPEERDPELRQWAQELGGEIAS